MTSFKFQISNFKFQGGQSLVEIILAIGLSAILLPALLTGLVASREGKVQQSQRTQAIYLLNETVDAIRSVREKGWTSFAANGTYHPVISGSNWTLATGSATVNGLTQTVNISDINRDASGVIVLSGGTSDPSSKKVDISISWGQPYSTSVDESLYITRYLDNNSFTQTSVVDFQTGTRSGTIITNTSGGEVILGAGGQGDWCAPNLSIAALDLPKNGVVNALTTIEGKAFAGTGNNSSGVSFANVSISNNNPPVTNTVGTLDGYKTNGVFGEEDYAYITTDNFSKHVVIIDLNQIVDGKHVETGYFDAPINSNAFGIYVTGNVGYVTVGSSLYSFDLSSKNGSRPQLGDISLSDPGRNIIVVGEYAYVSSTGSTQMQIIDVSNPNSMTVVGQASVDGKSAKGLFVNSAGTRVYIATGESASQREFFAIDTSIKTGNRPTLGSYESNGMDPKGVTVVTGNKAILVGMNEEEYQVIDLSNESNPTRCGGLHVNSGINGVSSVLEQDGDAYSYIITGDSNAEFKIIEGGPGGQYSSSGTFISDTFDSGYQTAFNRFDVSVNRPSSADITFQIALSQPVDGSCSGSTFNFVGPDATDSTFFTTSVTSGIQVFNYPIPISLNPGRCFKYKFYFSTTDSLTTPIFYDITGNYSP